MLCPPHCTKCNKPKKSRQGILCQSCARKNGNSGWTQQEIDLLKKMYWLNSEAQETRRQLMMLHTKPAIYTYAQRLGLHQRHKQKPKITVSWVKAL